MPNDGFGSPRGQRPWEDLPLMLAAARDEAGPPRAREAEAKLMTSLLDGIQRNGAALVLRGEPGIGKSRVLGVDGGRPRTRHRG